MEDLITENPYEHPTIGNPKEDPEVIPFNEDAKKDLITENLKRTLSMTQTQIQDAEK